MAGCMNRLKIVSDGSTQNTHLIDTKTGDDVTKDFMIQEITWTVGGEAGWQAGAVVTLKLRRLPVEMESSRVSAEVRGWLDDRSKEWREAHPQS